MKTIHTEEEKNTIFTQILIENSNENDILVCVNTNKKMPFCNCIEHTYEQFMLGKLHYRQLRAFQQKKLCLVNELQLFSLRPLNNRF